jgi:hypothetical protein
MRIFWILSWISLGFAFLCAGIIAADEMRRPQKMWIMNIVWPVTALYFSGIALWGYFRLGRSSRPGEQARASAQAANAAGREPENKQGNEQQGPPSLKQVALATSHCGAGCALADIVVETVVFAAALTILGVSLWASYVWDFVAAWSLGIVFQYFTIAPMRHLPPGRGILAAVKADTLSILAFQVGMYAWMALVFFRLFQHPHLHPNQPQFWFMMQIGMICGFATSFPMNRLLIQMGWKERMS